MELIHLFIFFFFESFVGLFDLGWVLRFVNVVVCCGFLFLFFNFFFWFFFLNFLLLFKVALLD